MPNQNFAPIYEHILSQAARPSEEFSPLLQRLRDRTAFMCRMGGAGLGFNLDGIFATWIFGLFEGQAYLPTVQITTSCWWKNPELSVTHESKWHIIHINLRWISSIKKLQVPSFDHADGYEVSHQCTCVTLHNTRRIHRSDWRPLCGHRRRDQRYSSVFVERIGGEAHHDPRSPRMGMRWPTTYQCCQRCPRFNSDYTGPWAYHR